MNGKALVFALAVLGLAPASWAQAPARINYQGVLARADGSAVPDGNYRVRFGIYDGGGVERFSETQENVSLTDAAKNRRHPGQHSLSNARSTAKRPFTNRL